MPKKTEEKVKEEKVEEKANPMARKGQYHYANGKRKTSIAKVRLYKGSGDIMVNGFPIDKYFFGTLIGTIKAPLKLVELAKEFDKEVK